MALVVIGTALNTVKSDAVPAIDKCMATGTSVPFLYNETICTTPQCHTMASQILNDLNPQADPCQDFSQFVCGGFYDKHEIPADQPTTDYFWMLLDQNNLTESGLGLPSKEYYQEQDTLRLYGSTIAQMFQIILGDEDIVPNNRAQPLTDADVKEEWKEAAKDVVEFET
ncbi:Membrane metallo-endopeptidase-like 1 [Mortierella sp. AD031]|nr:Membrane metallo-endopeptidase-like 1 [Mortierella sp. AD031]